MMIIKDMIIINTMINMRIIEIKIVMKNLEIDMKNQEKVDMKTLQELTIDTKNPDISKDMMIIEMRDSMIINIKNSKIKVELHMTNIRTDSKNMIEMIDLNKRVILIILEYEKYYKNDKHDKYEKKRFESDDDSKLLKILGKNEFK